MRLIDEDDVKTWLKERIDGYESLHLGGNSRSAELKIIIDELPVRVPAAYDPDKVVEQLENERKFWEHAYDKDLGEKKARSYAHAIEIVKGGGVDGN